MRLVATSEAISDAELARFRALAERSLEDHRGVDLTQVRDRLRLTPAERLRRMVHEVHALQAMVECANRAS